MAELLDFCLKLEAMLEVTAKWPGEIRMAVVEPPDPSLVYILADWLEEHGDRHRPQLLREMRIERLGRITWRVMPVDDPKDWVNSEDDAARELIRRAFELVTVPHECKLRLVGVIPNQVLVPDRNCPDCSGRGWVPAWAKACGECGGEGIVDSGGFTPWGASINAECPDCQGRCWGKVPIIKKDLQTLTPDA